MQSLHIETPLIESVPLSPKVKGKVWLKMEALQPSGSFKLRGIGNACQQFGVLADRENILVVVCGGAGVTYAQLAAWKQKIG